MNTNDVKTSITTRKSGIELLKIIGILLVVISHVTQTLESDFFDYLGFNDYFINLSNNTTSATTLYLIILRYSGTLGNTIFFTCSAWFLIDKNETNYKKIFRIMSDVFIFSILWLVTFIVVKGVNYIGIENIIKSLLPTFFENNWYITNYIIFCFIAPFLNMIIHNIEQKQHFLIMAVLSICYLCIGLLYSFPCSTKLVVWISIYFIVTYFKLYCQTYCQNTKLNLFIFIITFIGSLLLIVLTNVIGLKISLFSNKMQHWNKNASILNFIIAFCLLNIFNKFKFENRFINYISSCSLLVYIFHENILFRTYIRPYVWQRIYLELGYNMIVLWHACYVIILFVISLFVAFLYKKFIQKFVYKISDKIYLCMHTLLTKLTNKLISKLH